MAGLILKKGLSMEKIFLLEMKYGALINLRQKIKIIY